MRRNPRCNDGVGAAHSTYSVPSKKPSAWDVLINHEMDYIYNSIYIIFFVYIQYIYNIYTYVFIMYIYNIYIYGMGYPIFRYQSHMCFMNFAELWGMACWFRAKKQCLGLALISTMTLNSKERFCSPKHSRIFNYHCWDATELRNMFFLRPNLFQDLAPQFSLEIAIACFLGRGHVCCNSPGPGWTW